MSQQTAETSDAYTVVVFRGSSSKPLRFSFPRKFVRKLLILAAIERIEGLGGQITGLDRDIVKYSEDVAGGDPYCGGSAGCLSLCDSDRRSMAAIGVPG